MLEPRFVLVQPARNFLSTLRKRDFIDIDIVHSTSMTEDGRLFRCVPVGAAVRYDQQRRYQPN